MKKFYITAAIALIAGLLSGFCFGVATEKTVAYNRINHNVYCESGEVVQKMEDEEYLILMSSGNYFSFYSKDEIEIGIPINVCFDRGETDNIEDDIIIAIQF